MEKLAEAMVINDLHLVFTCEVNLELIENLAQIIFWFWEFTEQVAFISAPEETSFREAWFVVKLHANTHIIVTFKACNAWLSFMEM